MITQILSDAVPEPPPGTYSHALKVGDVLYMSGQHAGAPGGGLLGDDSVVDQTRHTFKKIVALVEAAGGSARDIVKITVYLTDIAGRPEVGIARGEFFSEPMPCSTLVAITALAAPELKVEIDAVAVIGASKTA
jgi:enamine deaminase RidA (YjgF/YER057c/UK114 family)